MAYLILSNLILILVPLLLMMLQRKSKYPERLDFSFSILTLFIVVFGFMPEHLNSMTFSDLTLVVCVFAFLLLIDKIACLDGFMGSKKFGRFYFLIALFLVTAHAFLDGMGFNMENFLLHAENSHELMHSHTDTHAHSHDYYSLSLGLLLHRFPIGVLIYQRFFAYNTSIRKGVCLILSMMFATVLGYYKYSYFAREFGADRFSHMFEYFVVALLLHFVLTHIYSMIRKKI